MSREVVTVTVKWFDAKKGWGFAEVPGRGDAFVHYSDIKVDGYKQLHEGQKIECEIVQGKGDKLKAINIKPLG